MCKDAERERETHTHSEEEDEEGETRMEAKRSKVGEASRRAAGQGVKEKGVDPTPQRWILEEINTGCGARAPHAREFQRARHPRFQWTEAWLTGRDPPFTSPSRREMMGIDPRTALEPQQPLKRPRSQLDGNLDKFPTFSCGIDRYVGHVPIPGWTLRPDWFIPVEARQNAISPFFSLFFFLYSSHFCHQSAATGEMPFLPR